MILDEKELLKRKKQFAHALLECDNLPGKAALIVFPESEFTGIALQLAQEWIRDPYVESETQRLLRETSGDGFLPSKSRQSLDLYALANDPKVDPDVRIKAHRLYAEMQGSIEKPIAGQTNILNQGVLIVSKHGTDEQWEKTAIESQRTLTGNQDAIN